jgi:hypothetical protein
MLFALVMSVSWDTCFALSRSVAALREQTVLDSGLPPSRNLAGPMSILMPVGHQNQVSDYYLPSPFHTLGSKVSIIAMAGAWQLDISPPLQWPSTSCFGYRDPVDAATLVRKGSRDSRS